MFVSKPFMLSMISFVELLWQLVVLLSVAHFMNIVFLESMIVHWLFQLIRRAGHTLFSSPFCVSITLVLAPFSSGLTYIVAASVAHC